jgi:dihydroneopterin aldolase
MTINNHTVSSWIHLKDLKITCIVGIHAKERELVQNLFLDIDLECSFTEAEASEHISQTVDYSELAQVMEQWVQQEQFQLIETLAVRGATLILEKWPQVNQCRIHVKKPGAVPQAQYAGVTHHAKRD